jgi:hypothetical protein
MHNLLLPTPLTAAIPGHATTPASSQPPPPANPLCTALGPPFGACRPLQGRPHHPLPRPLSSLATATGAPSLESISGLINPTGCHTALSPNWCAPRLPRAHPQLLIPPGLCHATADWCRACLVSRQVMSGHCRCIDWLTF